MKNNNWFWILLDKKGKILYRTDDVAKIFRKGAEYPYGTVFIEQRFVRSTCIF